MLTILLANSATSKDTSKAHDVKFSRIFFLFVLWLRTVFSQDDVLWLLDGFLCKAKNGNRTIHREVRKSLVLYAKQFKLTSFVSYSLPVGTTNPCLLPCISGLVSIRMIKQQKRIQVKAFRKRSPAQGLPINWCTMSCTRYEGPDTYMVIFFSLTALKVYLLFQRWNKEYSFLYSVNVWVNMVGTFHLTYYHLLK